MRILTKLGLKYSLETLHNQADEIIGQARQRVYNFVYVFVKQLIAYETKKKQHSQWLTYIINIWIERIRYVNKIISLAELLATVIAWK